MNDSKVRRADFSQGHRGRCSLDSVQRLREVASLSSPDVTSAVRIVMVAVDRRGPRRSLPSFRHQPTRRTYNSRYDINNVERIHQCLPLELANILMWLSCSMQPSRSTLARVVMLLGRALMVSRHRDLAQRMLVVISYPKIIPVGTIRRLEAGSVWFVRICENVQN